MKELTISDIDYSYDCRLSMRVRMADLDEELWFQLPSDAEEPKGDLIASVIAALFGTYFDRITFLHPTSAATRKNLEKVTSAQWTSPTSEEAKAKGGGNTILNFSGGFDSLAALALLGSDAKLVSVDFGERFHREKEFFQKFDTVTVSTNARKFERSWTFMAIGAILLRDYLEADFISFGNILEASPWHFVRRKGPFRTQAILQPSGLKAFYPLLGLTEFGTALIAAGEFPDEICDSLHSLAEKGSEKYFRKGLMLDAAFERIKLSNRPEQFDMCSIAPPRRKLSWGQSFAGDFLAPGIFKFCDPSFTPQWFDAPVGLRKFASDADLSLYWSECSASYTQTPAQFIPRIATLKEKYRIRPWDAQDWDEFRKIVELMSLHHIFPAQTF